MVAGGNWRDDLAFYQVDPNDPFRSLWLISCRKEIDSDSAKTLKQRTLSGE